ncbi:winged helix-turn-helix domain-containing protein [Rahnella variigena]|jgi:DNA-binding winged helix-turn-helix (wHTH) protein|uniref:winged helix-turn-helix domain-containing protein n=1 Tax=Rahnella variigena TaxID=574964 RepID=UPI001F0E2BE9|nr:winged helix-turn-helix domain-containing protein [Rahnella variigena]
MVYLIENQIVFNPEENSLSLLSDDESKITVSNPARRILLLLIEQQGVVVQRETFFKKVWDDYGLNASNNNLNHCISKLRKVISTLGYQNEFIVTVPKVGFIIRKEIIIETCVNKIETQVLVENSDEVAKEPDIVLSGAMPDDEIINHSVAPQQNATEPEPEPQKGKYHHYFIMSILVTAALTVWAIFIFYNDMSDPKADLEIAKIGSCSLYATAPVSRSNKSNFIQLAEDFLHKNNISCKPGHILIFQSELFSSPINTGSVREFLAQCSTDDNHKASVCISYYTNDRTTHDQ